MSVTLSHRLIFGTELPVNQLVTAGPPTWTCPKRHEVVGNPKFCSTCGGPCTSRSPKLWTPLMSKILLMMRLDPKEISSRDHDFSLGVVAANVLDDVRVSAGSSGGFIGLWTIGAYDTPDPDKIFVFGVMAPWTRDRIDDRKLSVVDPISATAEAQAAMATLQIEGPCRCYAASWLS